MLNQTILGNSLTNIVLAIVIIVIGFLLSKLFSEIFRASIKPFTRKTKTNIDDTIASIIELPTKVFIILSSFIIASELLVLNETFQSYFDRGMFMLIIIVGGSVLIKLLDLTLHKILSRITKKTESDFDDHLVPLIRKIIKSVMYIILFLIILENFGFDISAIIAGLGIGGLAFALAAKDILSNLFGGISIFLDGPFKPKDRIKVNNFDGTVEEIGLRTTKMRTLDDRVLTIPNSMLATEVIENITREKARKISMVLGLTYNTSITKIKKAKEIIKQIVKENKSTRDSCTVVFNEFGDFSLNLKVIYWIKDKDNIMTAKDEVNMAIKEKLDKAKIDFAFPTQTIELVKKK